MKEEKRGGCIEATKTGCRSINKILMRRNLVAPQPPPATSHYARDGAGRPGMKESIASPRRPRPKMCAEGLQECGYGDHDTHNNDNKLQWAQEAGAIVPSLRHRRLRINGLRIQRPTPAAVFYTLRKRPAID